METPYRNNQLIDDLIQYLKPETRLCIASNLFMNDQLIKSATVSWWKKNKTDIHKKPAIYLINV